MKLLSPIFRVIIKAQTITIFEKLNTMEFCTQTSEPKAALLWPARNRLVRAALTLCTLFIDYKLLQLIIFFSRSKEHRRNKIHLAHKRNALRLLNLFQKNGSTWIKAGQFLSARPDLLPIEYIETLTPLQHSVPAIPFSEIKPILLERYGAQWQNLFSFVNEVPVASASISQVYYAKMIDGREVALKIMRPNTKELCEQDFCIYRYLGKILSCQFTKVDLIYATDVFIESLRQELDFIQEASNIDTFGKLNHIEGIITPTLIPELCSEEIVATSWINGTHIIDHLKQSEKTNREKLLKLLQTSYIQQVIRFGIFQGDPHPGNFLVTEDEKIAILDFGYLGVLSDKERVCYAKLILSVIDGDHDRFIDTLKDGGLAHLTDPVFSRQLRKLLNLVTVKHTGPDTMSELEEVLKELLLELKKRKAHIPDHYFLTSRVLLTLTGLMKLFHITPKTLNIKQIIFSV